MKPWLGALLLVVGFAAGFVAAPRGDPGAAEALRQERDAMRQRADRAEADLAAARESKPRRRDAVELPKGAVAPDSREPFEDPKKPPAQPAAPDAPTAEARKKRLNEIRGELHTYFENHDGEKALAALKELAALGPEARDDAMKLAVDINADVNGAGELRLSMFSFYTGLGDPAIRDLMMWSLDNQASSPPGFRVISAYSVPWVMKPDEAIARFDTALAHEGDRGVQGAIIDNLGSMNTAKAESVLARVFGDATRDAALRADAVMALAGSKDPAVQRDIETAAASDPDPRVQNAAKLSLVVRNPPATGCLVTQMQPDSNAEASGIRTGDVLVSYNGRAVPTGDDLRREISAISGTDTIPVVVVRDGREQTIQVKPGKLGLPNLRPVAKK
jgi:hypothetical protein